MATKRRDAKRKPKSEAKVLKFTAPPSDAIEGKALVKLAQSDIMFSAIQIIEVTGDIFLKAEYVLRDEDTGAGSVDDDELLVQLLLRF